MEVMTSPTRERIIEAIINQVAFGIELDRQMGDIAEAVLAAIAPLAAIVPREATDEQYASAAFDRTILRYTYAAMVEAGDLTRERKDG
jgi:hypothetical protein